MCIVVYRDVYFFFFVFVFIYSFLLFVFGGVSEDWGNFGGGIEKFGGGIFGGGILGGGIIGRYKM